MAQMVLSFGLRFDSNNQSSNPTHDHFFKHLISLFFFYNSTKQLKIMNFWKDNFSKNDKWAYCELKDPTVKLFSLIVGFVFEQANQKATV